MGKHYTRGDESAIEFIMDGGGSALTTGVKGYVEVPFDCYIEGQTLLADQDGNLVVDIWYDEYANYPPTVADTITASAKPTLSSSKKDQDNILTGWTRQLLKGGVLAFNIDSVATVTHAIQSLRVSKL